MKISDKKLIIFFFIIIIILSIILIFKVLKSDTDYNKELYAQIYSEYDKIFENNENNIKDYIFQANNKNTSDNRVIAAISIPKINITYPVLSETNEEYLKIAPCKYSGGLPNNYGNFSIIGHNYKNDKFFSKLNKLEIGDSVILKSNGERTLTYNVYDIFEVQDNDFSPIEETTKDKIDLTLITCTDKKENRLIVKCRANV